MKPSVPTAPKSPCAVEERPAGLARATTAKSAGPPNANPRLSSRMIGTAQRGSVGIV
jgi:hypothetical protein